MGESPVRSSVTLTAGIFLVSTSTRTCIFTNPRLTFHFCLSHSPLLCYLRPAESTANRIVPMPPVTDGAAVCLDI